MFFMWMVGVAKVVVHFDCFDDANDSLGAEAATPGVMKVRPWLKFFRNASLRSLIAFGLEWIWSRSS